MKMETAGISEMVRFQVLMANKYKDGCHLEDHPVDEGMKLR
jgi:hypothetical protein